MRLDHLLSKEDPRGSGQERRDFITASLESVHLELECYTVGFSKRQLNSCQKETRDDARKLFLNRCNVPKLSSKARKFHSSAPLNCLFLENCISENLNANVEVRKDNDGCKKSRETKRQRSPKLKTKVGSKERIVLTRESISSESQK